MDCTALVTKQEIDGALAQLNLLYDGYKAQGLKLDMQRGRPCAEQLGLSNAMLDWGGAPYLCENGVDARNYGGDIEGTPEARRVVAEMLDVLPRNVIVWGSSSLNIMYDCIAKALLLGVYGGSEPWLAQAARGGGGKLKFLCPVPGYDRHFLITERLGFEMINVEMRADGPDMDAVERLVESDELIKGIWNIPKYNNPTGITYSDAVVRRFAALRPKARDFRIFWDNSYCVHDLYGESDSLTELISEAKKHGNEDMVYVFTSTSKVTFAGAGLAAIAASENNVKFIGKQLSVQSIGADKLNQLRHARFIQDRAHLKEIMARHAELIRPKFELVLSILKEEFGETAGAAGAEGAGGLCAWNNPRGGYFISLDAPDFCATEALRLAAEAGVRFTPAGATFPYGKDPRDRNIRIAPTVPSLDEVRLAVRVLALCVKLAYLNRKRRTSI
ncbi:MAG: aminotransferase [Clostridiales bacterium]|jgi:aspartate/methionine/tyrosine aminotransferase|nr:aminotransferase [Clostridiales bacterium]